jgi:hypothetical protein
MRKAFAALTIAGLASLSPAAPAGARAAHGRCPSGFARVANTQIRSDAHPERVDRNNNGFICVKDTKGKGNTGLGFSLRDDNSNNRR